MVPASAASQVGRLGPQRLNGQLTGRGRLGMRGRAWRRSCLKSLHQPVDSLHWPAMVSAARLDRYRLENVRLRQGNKVEVSATDEHPILIVDDDEGSLELLKCKLVEQGHRVATAQCGAEALALARELRPQLILLDAVMPGMDGFEVCRRLKEDADTRQTPVVFLVTSTDPIDKLHGLTIGGLDYITKPFDDAELLARTATALRLKQMQDELRRETDKDSVTGLATKDSFEEQFQRECNRSRRYESSFALVLVGIDNFKEIDDRHGRLFGDSVLKEVASILNEAIRESDFAARGGNDRFTVMLPQGDLPTAIGFAKRLYKAVAKHVFRSDDQTVPVTISTGVVSGQHLGGRDPSELLELGRECLDAAKKAGGDKISYRTPAGDNEIVRL